MYIAVDEKRVAKGLLLVFLVIFVMNFMVHYIKAVHGYDTMLGLHTLFSFYDESNLPTWYSVFLLGSSAMLLGYIAVNENNRHDKRYWFWLSWVFIYLSFDEAAQIHEFMGKVLYHTIARDLLPSGHRSAWVFYGGALTLLVIAVFFKLWLRLSPRVKWLFFTAATLFIGGALGFEVIEIYYLAANEPDMGFYVLVTIEESLEILGIILFIYALLIQIKMSGSGLNISTSNPG